MLRRSRQALGSVNHQLRWKWSIIWETEHQPSRPRNHPGGLFGCRTGIGALYLASTAPRHSLRTTPRRNVARFLKIVFLLYFWPQATNWHGIMLFCSKNEKCNSDFFCPEKSSNPKIFLILNFSNSGQPSRLFMKMGLCDFSANLTPTDKNLNFTCKKMKKEKNGQK